jgi:hypothetical protein
MATTKRSKRQPIDPRRVGQLAFDFFKANQATLFSPQVSMATLNQDYDKAATEMFRRLAHEPGLSLAGTPTGVLAVMCWRIAKLIKLVRDRPDRLPESDLLFDDVEARAFLFEQVLGSVSLPAEQHGKLLIDESPGLVH